MLLDDTNLVGASEEELEKAQECQTLVLDLIKTGRKNKIKFPIKSTRFLTSFHFRWKIDHSQRTLILVEIYPC